MSPFDLFLYVLATGAALGLVALIGSVVYIVWRIAHFYAEGLLKGDQ